jgi:hypothetical protein
MARGQISDEDLSSGLKGLGGFGALGGAKVIKDSPFRDSRSEHKTLEVAKAPERPVAAKKAVVPVEGDAGVTVEAKPVSIKATPKPLPAKKAAVEPQATAQGRRVADIYTERVTLQLSPEMRDRVDALARELQRSKTGKSERITANTVIRVAVKHLIRHFSLEGEDIPNDEEELFAAVEKRCTWK